MPTALTSIDDRLPDERKPAADPLAGALALDASADLATVLAAWDAATTRLQETHEALRKEVQRLTDELEAKNRELARKNRLADLGQMAAHVAHEVRNSLVPVTLYLSVLRRRLAHDPPGLEVLGKVEAAFTALDATVHDLLHFTADRDPHWECVTLGPLVDEVLASVCPQMAAQAIHAAVEIDPACTLRADRDMIRRAILNLVLNALDAMPAGGTLRISAVCEGEDVLLRVADTGPGLEPEAARRAFEPFFTTKAGGTGLGLAIVDRIVDVHGGSVTAANAPEGGAVFTLRLPRTARRPGHDT